MSYTYASCVTSNKIVLYCPKCAFLGDSEFVKLDKCFLVRCLNCNYEFKCNKLTTATNGISFCEV
jgi:hypothetical protein